MGVSIEITGITLMKPQEINLKQQYMRIPTKLTEQQFDKFVLVHLSIGRRGPDCSIPLYKVFNYVLHLMHTGMQWMNLPIEKRSDGSPEIHYTRIFRIYQRWVNDGSLKFFLKIPCCY